MAAEMACHARPCRLCDSLARARRRLKAYRGRLSPEAYAGTLTRARSFAPRKHFFRQRAAPHYKPGSTMKDAATLATRRAAWHHRAEEQTAVGAFWRACIRKRRRPYFSMILRPRCPGCRAHATLVARLAVREHPKLTGRATDVRWPNDVLLDRRKCAGYCWN